MEYIDKDELQQCILEVEEDIDRAQLKRDKAALKYLWWELEDCRALLNHIVALPHGQTTNQRRSMATYEPKTTG